MQNDQEILTPAMLGPDTLPFDSAEYESIGNAGRCRICSRNIFDNYYRVNNQVSCAKCAGESREGQPADSRAAFSRGLCLGMVAAVMGLVLYATFAIATSFYFGFVALGVGWLVAKAILIGSNGMGGRRYQIAAVLLAYIAISTSAIPIKIVTTLRHHKEKISQQRSINEAEASSANLQSQASPKLELRDIALKLLMLGIASPLLDMHDPLRGFFGMIILLLSLRIAYGTAGAQALDVDGPFRATEYQ